MIRFIVLLAFVAVMAFLPVYAFDAMVMPELAGLKSAYGNAEAAAQHVVSQ